MQKGNVMKILKAHNWYFVGGGADKVYFEIMRLLEKHGHEVIPFSMKDLKNYNSAYKEYFVNEIDYSKIKPSLENLKTAFKMIYSFEAGKKISALIRKTELEIAHLHNIYGRLTPSIIYSLKKHNIPVVMTLHDYKLMCPSYHMTYRNKPCESCKWKKYYKAIINKCHKNSFLASFVYALETYIYTFLKTYIKYIDILIAPSKFMMDKLIEYGFPEDKIEYIPNFINIDVDYSLSFDGDYILYSGKLIEVKGLFTLLKAVKEIKKYQLYIAGDGELRSNLEDYVKMNNLSNVKFLGHLGPEEMCKILKEASFVVLPSECYENAPLAVLEAFAYGKPVIGANIGGIPEMVIDGQTGLLFESGNYEDLKDKINYLLNNPSKIVEMGKNAQKKVKEEYNEELHYKRLMDVYKRTIRLEKVHP